MNKILLNIVLCMTYSVVGGAYSSCYYDSAFKRVLGQFALELHSE